MAAGVSTMMGGLENDNVVVVPNEVPGTPSLTGNLSGITEELGSPKMPTGSLTATEMVLPPTPEQNMNFVIDKNMNDAGYDFNGDIGPARYAPRMEEEINVDEDEVLIQVPNPNEVENDSNENIGLTNDKIEKMKVSELNSIVPVRRNKCRFGISYERGRNKCRNDISYDFTSKKLLVNKN